MNQKAVAQQPNTLKRTRTLTPWFGLMIVLVAGFTWRAFFIYRDVAWLTNYWLFEDFGYSLKIAKNIASGFGETFDGVVPTNGYQPLYVWLLVPVFCLFKGDLITPIYVAVTLLAVANVATGIFIYSILRRFTCRRSLALLGVAFWMLNLAIAKDGTNGLEAGLSTMLIAATLDYFLKLDERILDPTKALTLGILAGVSFLARVDAVFLAAAIFFVILLPGSASPQKKLRFLMAVGIGFLSVSGPYTLWNLVNFGSVLPTSGQVTTGKSSLFDLSEVGVDQLIHNVEYGLFIIGKMLVGITTPGGVVVSGPSGRELYIPYLTAIALLGVVVVGVKRAGRERLKPTLLVAVLMLMYLWGYTVHSFVPFERYFLPIMLCFVILASVSFAVLKPRLRFVVGSILLSSAVLIGNASPFFHPKDFYTPGWFLGVQKLNEITKNGETVAASQSGNLGYFYENGRAINLDGVVNMDAYGFRRSGTIDKYIIREKVKYLADEDNWIFILADQIADAVDRRRFYASLTQRYASRDAAFSIYEFAPVLYRAMFKLPPSEKWARIPHSAMIDGYAIRAIMPGDSLQFSASSCFDLKFLTHDWSGILTVFRDGVRIREVDLYSKAANPTYKEHFDQDMEAHVYTLQISGKKNPASRGTEVWLDAVLEREECDGVVGTAPLAKK